MSTFYAVFSHIFCIAWLNFSSLLFFLSIVCYQLLKQKHKCNFFQIILLSVICDLSLYEVKEKKTMTFPKPIQNRGVKTWNKHSTFTSKHSLKSYGYKYKHVTSMISISVELSWCEQSDSNRREESVPCQRLQVRILCWKVRPFWRLSLATCTVELSPEDTGC